MLCVVRCVWCGRLSSHHSLGRGGYLCAQAACLCRSLASRLTIASSTKAWNGSIGCTRRAVRPDRVGHCHWSSCCMAGTRQEHSTLASNQGPSDMRAPTDGKRNRNVDAFMSHGLKAVAPSSELLAKYHPGMQVVAAVWEPNLVIRQKSNGNTGASGYARATALATLHVPLALGVRARTTSAS